MPGSKKLRPVFHNAALVHISQAVQETFRKKIMRNLRFPLAKKASFCWKPCQQRAPFQKGSPRFQISRQKLFCQWKYSATSSRKYTKSRRYHLLCLCLWVFYNSPEKQAILRCKRSPVESLSRRVPLFNIDSAIYNVL